MKNYPLKLALLALFALAVVQASGAQSQPQPQSQPQASQQPQAQPPAEQAQSQQPQAQSTEAPPHVDAEPNPEDRTLEDSIKKDLTQDAHMAYSRVTVHVTDTAVELDGVVATATAKDQAAKIAGEHAGSRKIKNKLKINPNTHPSGM